ncbi:MAG: NADPH-dependent 7-cyano-7-deazaguanine reductase QueF [Phycisphaerales bacterium]|nr:NADPH-dependent 7-cyano-7-deazaguanine reductase QueF [Phycisphaerales bacterium]
MPRKTDPAKLLEVFPNPNAKRDYTIRHVAPEFTSRCPRTGQPDFGKVIVEYIPDRTCVELKSLKLYLQSFREMGIFYEAVTNRILDDLLAAMNPRYLLVETRWTPRGGLRSIVRAEHPIPESCCGCG